jgi:hypothetical protein
VLCITVDKTAMNHFGRIEDITTLRKQIQTTRKLSCYKEEIVPGFNYGYS